MPRRSPGTRRAFTDAVKRRLARTSALLPGSTKKRREDAALTALATLAGTMILARSVDDPDFSDRISAAARAQLKTQQ